MDTFLVAAGLIIGFFIFLLVLGLGGPTGIAANPARDFSPRVAHFMLPIPNKGPSEFYYSWIPFFAPLCGGCAAAGLYAATQLLNQSQV
jgi:glycerol uptake facilitator protein